MGVTDGDQSEQSICDPVSPVFWYPFVLFLLSASLSERAEVLRAQPAPLLVSMVTCP